MADNTINVEVDLDDAGVLTRHHLRMQNDQEYRDRTLTPPGGNAPGENGKEEAPTPDDAPVPAGAVQQALATR